MEGNWKAKTLLIGGAIGLVTGLVAAYLFIQRAEAENDHPRLTAGEGVKVGVGVIGLLKLVTDLANPRK